MALFGLFGNFTKPGPGVSKDEPPKPGPIRFFEIFFRKFSKLCQANLIFFLPVAAAAALMVLLYLSPTHVILSIGTTENPLEIDVWSRYVMPLPLVLVAPFAAGLTYITRNFVREQHAFIWSDFWDAVKGNWKYFLLNGLIVYAAYVILSFSIIYYNNRAAVEGLYYVPLWICVLIAVLFLFAQFYLPVMFITFDLKFGQAYKNAMIFILAGFWRNLVIAAVIAAIAVGVLVVPLINLVVFLMLAAIIFIVFSFFSYLVNFMVYPVIDKYMIKPFERQQAVARGEILPDEDEPTTEEKREAAFYAPPESVLDDDEEQEDDEDKYVFINGKLVKKSELKPRERDELGE